MDKKIMFLGGSPNSVELIEYANMLGYETYLCDNTDCIGKKVAKYYYSTSAANVDGVIKIMKQHNIDNVIAYGNDYLAEIQAEIAERLHIKGNPVNVIKTLTQKDLFRKFLSEHNFNNPYIATYTKETFDIDDEKLQKYPIMIKPVDSAGSKGVTKVLNKDMLKDAFNYALKYSKRGVVIAEKFIVNKYNIMISGDIFVNNGEILFYGLLNTYRDDKVNPFLPMGTSSYLFITKQEEFLVKKELDRLVKEVGFIYGGMNVEIMIDKNNDIYFIELAPRNGGNRISDQIEYAYGVNLRELMVDATVNNILNIKPIRKELTLTFVIHSYIEGIFDSISLDKALNNKIIKKWIFLSKGDRVEYFSNASNAVGVLLLEFNSVEELKWFIDNHDILIHVNLVEE